MAPKDSTWTSLAQPLALLFVVMAMFMIVAAFRRLLPRFACYQLHATFGATARLVFDNLRVHTADGREFDVQGGGSNHHR